MLFTSFLSEVFRFTKVDIHYINRIKLCVLNILCSITEIDIGAFLDSLYNEREQYNAYNNTCKTEGACSFFKYVSICTYK